MTNMSSNAAILLLYCQKPFNLSSAKTLLKHHLKPELPSNVSLVADHYKGPPFRNRVFQNQGCTTLIMKITLS